MPDFLRISEFLSPIDLHRISGDEVYRDGQLGKTINIYQDEFPDLQPTELVIVGCGEQRGAGWHLPHGDAPDYVRAQLYNLYCWHTDIHIADIGNIHSGSSMNDSVAALATVVQELVDAGKTVIIIGGSHDLTLAQYNAYLKSKKLIEATCIDALVDIDIDSPYRAENFLMEMLTSEPNFIRHYNHLGFQTYLAHPRMLETMDKLRFDCYRLGYVREHIEEMEPVIRNSQMLSFDIRAMANAYAPSVTLSPNGFTGEEACLLLRYAGMSKETSTIGIYGYDVSNDQHALTAKQISQMIWYIIDGRSRGSREAALDEKEAFNEFHMAFAEVEACFLQSKKTGRWWMQLPDKRFIACSYRDYLAASNNEIPERWLRSQERG